MNTSEFKNDIHYYYGNDYTNYNTALAGNRSGQPTDEFVTIDALSDVIFYVVLSLGIPGNILSAIVWLRRHVSSKNSSAIYLAALAINDLLYLLRLIIHRWIPLGSHQVGWLWRGLGESARILEPLLVLSFSLERLFAIVRPLQVSCVHLSLIDMVTMTCSVLPPPCCGNTCAVLT